MTEKYYTPSIEEFHVGFEYEFRSTNDQMEPWQESVIRDGAQIDDITRQIIGGRKAYELRVKYLDREDVESLGGDLYAWPQDDIERSDTEIMRFGFGESDRDYQYVVRIYPGNPCRIKAWAVKGNKHFDGIVKNKSELKRILIQVGIA